MIKDSLLPKFYHEVLSLREYMLAKLPTTSKTRRKRILEARELQIAAEDSSIEHFVECFSDFLDNTLIGLELRNEGSSKLSRQQWIAFSQQLGSTSSTVASGAVQDGPSQCEVCSTLKHSSRRICRVPNLL